MNKQSLFSIMFLFLKSILSHMVGEDAQATTVEPMSLASLTIREWCSFQPNYYDCGEKKKRGYRYFYDPMIRGCRSTVVGDCDDNYNIFDDITACHGKCRTVSVHSAAKNLTPNVFCRLQSYFGTCEGYYPMWYFDVSSKTCKSFSYSGCGGNQNKFQTINHCTNICVPAVTYNVDEIVLL